MAKARRKNTLDNEPDALYFLKILLFFIVGAVWIRTTNTVLLGISGLPVGLVLGLLFAQHEHFRIDRKIEYLVLLLAAVLSYVAPVGIVLQF